MLTIDSQQFTCYAHFLFQYRTVESDLSLYRIGRTFLHNFLYINLTKTPHFCAPFLYISCHLCCIIPAAYCDSISIHFLCTPCHKYYIITIQYSYYKTKQMLYLSFTFPFKTISFVLHNTFGCMVANVHFFPTHFLNCICEYTPHRHTLRHQNAYIHIQIHIKVYIHIYNTNFKYEYYMLFDMFVLQKSFGKSSNHHIRKQKDLLSPGFS